MSYQPRHEASKTIAQKMGPMPDPLRERFVTMTVDYYRRHPERLPESIRHLMRPG